MAAELEQDARDQMGDLPLPGKRVAPVLSAYGP